jgi:hypothetical protein
LVPRMQTQATDQSVKLSFFGFHELRKCRIALVSP